MKKFLIALFMMTMCLTGCDDAGEEVSMVNTDQETTSSATEEVTEADVTEEATEEETTEAEVTEEETTEADVTEEATESESDESTSFYDTIKPLDFKLADGLSEDYVDFENMSFVYDGTKFTVGTSTFKDLIEGGIPFDEDALNNKENNVNKNYSTSYYTVDINDGVSMQFTFSNFTDQNLKEEECVLSDVRFYTLYTPSPEYSDSINSEAYEALKDASTKVQFSYPLDLKKEALLEKHPEPTKNDEYGNVEYEIKSEKYYGRTYIKFQFNKDTDKLDEIYYSYLP